MEQTRMDLISVAVLLLAGSVQAQYHNDFSTLDQVKTGTQVVPGDTTNTSDPYLDEGGAVADVNGWGYAQLYWLNDGEKNPVPINMTNGEITITVRNDNPAVADGTPQVEFLRVYIGTWDSVNSVWIQKVRPFWPMEVPVNLGWTTFTFCTNEFQDVQYYNGGTEADINFANVYRMRIDVPYWEPAALPYTFGIDDIDITASNATLTADAGPDQTIAGGCTASQVQFDGSGSSSDPAGRIVNYTWREGTTDLATGVDGIAELTVGTHTVTLTVDDGGCLQDTDEVTITVTGGASLPVFLPMDQQVDEGLGEVITVTSNPRQVEFIEANPPDEPQAFARFMLNGGYYDGPQVHLDRYCFPPLDLSTPGMWIKFNARVYHETGDYGDAPIAVKLWDTSGKWGSIGDLVGGMHWFYGPSVPVELQYPVWQECAWPVGLAPENNDHYGTATGFDLTRVVRVEFQGTDWAGGAGNDYIDLRDLVIFVGDDGPIDVSAAGSDLSAFDAQPPFSKWSTLSVAGGPDDITDDAGIDTAMLDIDAGSITLPLGTQADEGPFPIAYWRTEDLKLGTEPNGNAMTLVMATLKNTSGGAMANLTVSYKMGLGSSALGEQIKGHRIYWSKTGAAGTWTAVGDFLLTAPGTKDVSFDLGAISWADGEILHVVWADDNGGDPEAVFTLDDVSFTPSTAPPLNPPTSLSATGGPGRVSLAWSAPAAGATPTGYEVFRGAAKIADVPATPTSYTDSDGALVPGTEYCYTVKSAAGGRTSGPSNVSCATPTGAEPNFHRGDANADGTINITDGIFVLNFLFLGGPKPTCLEAANPNDDTGINITDGIYILNFLFLGGPKPTAPGPADMPCGPDPAGNNLGCEAYDRC